MSIRKTASLLPLGIALCAPLLSASNAASFPEKPLRVIVPLPPGGAADGVARIVAQKLGENLLQPVVVDNRTGAGTIVGTEVALKGAPDGYTLFMLTPPTAINVTLVKNLPYDARTALVPVVTLGKIPLIILVPASSPANTVRDLVAISKQKAGGLRYASSGNGGSPHLTMEMLRKSVGIDLLHVPYQGAAPSVTALFGGHVDVMSTASLGKQQLASSKVRALATTGSRRWFMLPDTPTVAEQGFPQFEASSWQGLAVPKGTPRDRIEMLNREVVKVLRSPDVIERMSAQGFEIVGDTPQEAARWFESEIVKWGEMVKFSGARID